MCLVIRCYIGSHYQNDMTLCSCDNACHIGADISEMSKREFSTVYKKVCL